MLKGSLVSCTCTFIKTMCDVGACVPRYKLNKLDKLNLATYSKYNNNGKPYGGSYVFEHKGHFQCQHPHTTQGTIIGRYIYICVLLDQNICILRIYPYYLDDMS
jgi:hypothetical protein